VQFIPSNNATDKSSDVAHMTFEFLYTKDLSKLYPTFNEYIDTYNENVLSTDE